MVMIHVMDSNIYPGILDVLLYFLFFFLSVGKNNLKLFDLDRVSGDTRVEKTTIAHVSLPLLILFNNSGVGGHDHVPLDLVGLQVGLKVVDSPEFNAGRIWLWQAVRSRIPRSFVVVASLTVNLFILRLHIGWSCVQGFSACFQDILSFLFSRLVEFMG